MVARSHTHAPSLLHGLVCAARGGAVLVSPRLDGESLGSSRPILAPAAGTVTTEEEVGRAVCRSGACGVRLQRALTCLDVDPGSGVWSLGTLNHTGPLSRTLR